MSGLWPWLAVAALGALHGLNPVGGWPLAAAWGRRALLPLAAGHVVSVAVVAGLAALGGASGVVPDRWLLVPLAAVLLLGLRLRHAQRRVAGAAPAGLALWSFIVSTAHGAGLMLVPALVPLCLSDTPARAITASGSLGLALLAVGLHGAALLAVTALLGAAAGRLTSAFRCAWRARLRRASG